MFQINTFCKRNTYNECIGLSVNFFDNRHFLLYFDSSLDNYNVSCQTVLSGNA